MKKQRKILIIAGNDLRHYGGGERYILNLSDHLISRGYEVSIFSRKEFRDKVDKAPPLCPAENLGHELVKSTREAGWL